MVRYLFLWPALFCGTALIPADAAPLNSPPSTAKGATRNDIGRISQERDPAHPRLNPQVARAALIALIHSPDAGRLKNTQFADFQLKQSENAADCFFWGFICIDLEQLRYGYS